MSIKTVYKYNEKGILIEKIVLDDSDKSPISGAWQIPAFCTDKRPPASKDGYVAVFDGKLWRNIRRYDDIFVYSNNGTQSRKEKYGYIVKQGEKAYVDTPDEAQLRADFPDYDNALKEKTLRELESEYQENASELSSAMVTAQLNNDTQTVKDIQEEFAELQKMYRQAKEEI